MNVVHPMNASLEAVAAMPTRPATAAIYDAPAVRLVVFRIEPGQEVAPHTNNGTVILTVLSGTGSIMGGTEWRELGPGSVVSYAPDEPHAMKAGADRFCLMATIIRAC